MTESSDKYMCISDNDILPPKLSPNDWLSQMVAIMDRHPEIGLLTPQLPPQFLQMPYQILDDVIYAKAIGNTFKVCRMEAMKKIVPKIEQSLGKFGDDGHVSELIEQAGYKVAFCKNLFVCHLGQCLNWGYKPEEIALDPRKAGYGEPFTYKIVNEETFEPEPRWKM